MKRAMGLKLGTEFFIHKTQLHSYSTEIGSKGRNYSHFPYFINATLDNTLFEGLLDKIGEVPCFLQNYSPYVTRTCSLGAECTTCNSSDELNVCVECNLKEEDNCLTC